MSLVLPFLRHSVYCGKTSCSKISTSYQWLEGVYIMILEGTELLQKDFCMYLCQTVSILQCQRCHKDADNESSINICKKIFSMLNQRDGDIKAKIDKNFTQHACLL